MKTTFRTAIVVLSLLLLQACATGTGSTTAAGSLEAQQVRANNLQTLNAGRAGTLAGD